MLSISKRMYKIYENNTKTMIIMMMIFLIIMIQEPGANYRVSTNTKQNIMSIKAKSVNVTSIKS